MLHSRINLTLYIYLLDESFPCDRFTIVPSVWHLSADANPFSDGGHGWMVYISIVILASIVTVISIITIVI